LPGEAVRGRLHEVEGQGREELQGLQGGGDVMPNIADLTRQLREEIRKQYGLEAGLQINIHSHHYNAHLKRDSSGQIALAMAHCFKDATVRHDNSDGVYWVNVEAPSKENTRVAIFYPEEVS
jgi:hypothetical protein